MEVEVQMAVAWVVVMVAAWRCRAGRRVTCISDAIPWTVRGAMYFMFCSSRNERSTQMCPGRMSFSSFASVANRMSCRGRGWRQRNCGELRRIARRIAQNCARRRTSASNSRT